MSRKRTVKATRTPPYKRLYEQAVKAAEDAALQADTARVEIEFWKRRAVKAETSAAGLASSSNRFAREADRHAEARAMLLDDIQNLATYYQLAEAQCDRLMALLDNPSPLFTSIVGAWRRAWA